MDVRGEPVGLDGRAFASTAVLGRDLVAGTVIEVAFRDGTLTAMAGCNRMAGLYRLEVAGQSGWTLVIDGRGLAITGRGCDPERHAQDRWLADLLQGRPTVRLPADGEMSIADGTSTVRFAERDLGGPGLR